MNLKQIDLKQRADLLIKVLNYWLKYLQSDKNINSFLGVKFKTGQNNKKVRLGSEKKKKMDFCLNRGDNLRIKAPISGMRS